MKGSTTATVLFWIIGLSLVVSSYGEIVNSLNCTRNASEKKAKCVVHSVSISPCANAPDGPCDIQRGTNISISIQMTPKVKIGKKMSHLYAWESTIDIPFKGISSNACEFMPCPSRKNRMVTYEGQIPTKRAFPAGNYPVKIKIFQGKRVIFCQVVKIRLT